MKKTIQQYKSLFMKILFVSLITLSISFLGIILIANHDDNTEGFSSPTFKAMYAQLKDEFPLQAKHGQRTCLTAVAFILVNQEHYAEQFKKDHHACIKRVISTYKRKHNQV